MSIFMYRWRWDTIHKNLWEAGVDILYGIKNVIRWAPVIWKDVDWDWSSLAAVMEYKLRRMSHLSLTQGHHMSSDRHGKQQLICAVLLRRLLADKYDEGYLDQPPLRMAAYFRAADQRRKNDGLLLGKILGKNLTRWWD